MNYILSVSEINRYMRELVSKDLILSNLWVKGEISNFKRHYSGHIYFTLKDEKSVLRCVMFRSYASALKFLPENGMRVIIKGYVSVYERDGQYQLYVEDMQLDGIGNLHVAFEQLKARLQKEGIFDTSTKKPIPMLPLSIGVVTSPTGSVIKDILHVLNRRFENASVKIFPVQVQGEVAAAQICNAIKKFNELSNVDVIIIARGGGSLEELWPFNEEMVARTIYESNIPIVSAVGHETDYTISDFAADLRAPTPSAAAEIVMPERRILIERLNNLKNRLELSVLQSVGLNRLKLEKIMNNAVFKHPFDRINQERLRIDTLNRNIFRAIKICKQNYESKLSLLIEKLEALSPLGVLSRGYAIIKRSTDDRLIKSIKDTSLGDILDVRVTDGSIKVLVKEKKCN